MSSELACVYAALILADDGMIQFCPCLIEVLFVLDVAITPEKITTILKAAGVEVEPYWPGLFAKALESCDLKSLITTVGSGVGAAGPSAAGVGAPAAGGAAPATEAAPAKEPEPESEEDDDMGFGLFD